jgi:ammonia channel protein AmtB
MPGIAVLVGADVIGRAVPRAARTSCPTVVGGERRPSLWLGHFGFNSGSALGANSRTAFRVVLLDAGSNMALTGSLHSSLLDQPGRPA